MMTARLKIVLLLVNWGIILLSMATPGMADQTSSKPFQETMTPMGHCISGEELFKHSVTVSPDSRHLAYVSRIGPHFRVWHDGTAETSYPGVTRQSPFFSPRDNHLAFIAQKDGHMFAVVDNKVQDKYAQVGSFTFSPDGSSFAYRAENKDGEQFVVMDGKKGPAFPVGVTHKLGLIFSPDSNHLAYVGINKNGSHILVKDHKKQDSFNEITNIKFSPDSRHLAAVCKKDGKWMVVKDGQKGKRYQKVNNLVFSKDSEHIAYTAQVDKELIVVKDDQEFDAGAAALNPAFSPDGSRFAYLAMDDERKTRYVIDGKKGMVLGKPGRLIFSADSERVAYGAWIGGDWYIICDEQKGPAFESVLFFSFSPYSSELVYGGKKEDGRLCVVTNNEAGEINVEKSYQSIGIPVFSPDKKTLAYVATTDKDKMVMVVNGEEMTPYPAIGIPGRKNKAGNLTFTSQKPFFSPDGARMAYPVFNQAKEAFMVVDGQAHPTFEAVGRPTFSPDGTHIAYTAYQDGQSMVVINGQPSENRFDGIPRGAALKFDADNHCYLLVVQETEPGPSFFRLEMEIN